VGGKKSPALEEREKGLILSRRKGDEGKKKGQSYGREGREKEHLILF